MFYAWGKQETCRGVRAQDTTSEWKQGPSVCCLIKCARPRPAGGTQLVPSDFPATDCRWRSIDGLKGSPYSHCLLIRLGGRTESPKTWKGIQEEGKWCEMSEGWKWTLEGQKRRDRKRRFWGRVDAEMSEVFRPLQVDVHFTPVNPLQVTKAGIDNQDGEPGVPFSTAGDYFVFWIFNS